MTSLARELGAAPRARRRSAGASLRALRRGLRARAGSADPRVARSPAGGREAVERAGPLGLTAVIVAVTAEEPRVAHGRRRRRRGSEDALPVGPARSRDRPHARARRCARWVREQRRRRARLRRAALHLRQPLPRSRRAARRSRAWSRSPTWRWCARRRSRRGARRAWRGWYEFLPWEDWRGGRPALLDRTIAPALERWIRSGRDAAAAAPRRERVDIGFGLRGAAWDGERVLDRYELLYEAGLVDEAWRAGGGRGETAAEETVSAPADPASGSAARWRSTTGGSSPPRSGGCAARSATGRWSSSCCRRPSPCCQLQRSVEALAGRAAAQAELPPPGRSRRAGRGDRAVDAANRRPAGRAVPLPPRGAARAPGAGSRPARPPHPRLSGVSQRAAPG